MKLQVEVVSFGTLSLRQLSFSKLISLTDLWKEAGSHKNTKPNDWLRLPGSQRFIREVKKQDAGKSRNLIESHGKSGTYAHWQIALAYAKYLSPALHMKVNEVFMRYNLNDISLAEEIFDNASHENQKWLAKRIASKAERKHFTDTLDKHGVTGWGYGKCTDNIYYGLFNKRTAALKRELQTTSVRDEMDIDSLVSVQFAELMARKRIENKKKYGNKQCSDACFTASRKVSKMLLDA